MTTKIPAGIHVFADQRCLYEIISILLDNAVKYCDAGGCISVSAEKRNWEKVHPLPFQIPMLQERISIIRSSLNAFIGVMNPITA